jgi:hypothetical protein
MAEAAPIAELVMFVEASCPWCARWDREVGGAYPRSEEGRRAPLRRIHISEARRSGFTLSGAVAVTPTFILVDRGVEVGRITGYPGADFFWGMLDHLLDRLPSAPAGNGSRDARSDEPQGADREIRIGPRRLAAGFAAGAVSTAGAPAELRETGRRDVP